MRRFIIAILSVTLSGPLSATAPAEELNDIPDTKQLCARAATAFGEGRSKDAIEMLKPHWPLPVEEIDSLAYQTQSQLKMAAERFGPAVGSDFVRTRTAGNSLVKHVFIGKFERHAVRFICVFYKPGDVWVVNSVNWDDQTSLLFEND